MSNYPRFALLAGALGATALMIAGCSSSSSTAAAAPDAHPSATTASTTTTASGSTTSATPSKSVATTPQEQAAEAAFRGMIADWVAAGVTANYQDPALAHHMSGSALSWVTRHLAVEQSEHVVVKGTPTLANVSFGEQVPASAPTEIVINSDFNDSAWLEYTTDGHLYNNQPGGCHKTQVLAVNQSGTWKIDQLAMNAVGTC